MENQPASNGNNLHFMPVEEQFKLMADTAPVMIWIAGQDKMCYYFNKVWLNFTGRVPEQEYSNGWAESVHPDDLKKSLSVYNTNFNARQEFKTEYRLRRHDGVYRWVLDNGIAFYNSNGQFAGFIGSCVDINDLKELELRKDDFISAASHELKTPLTTLKVYAQVLEESLKKGEKEQALEYVTQINKQIHKFSNLINDLVDLPSLQARLTDYDKSPFDYETLLRGVIDHFQTITPARNIQIEGRCNKKIPGDKDRLAQVIINLLSNAFKFSQGSGSIIVTVAQVGNFIKTSVTDHGIGIPRESRTKIFEKFYRVSDSTNKTFPGLGIGLFFSSQIVKNHGGEIWVEDTAEKQTTISFTIPYLK
jgi:PAS domain S-box-containing protein